MRFLALAWAAEARASIDLSKGLPADSPAFSWTAPLQSQGALLIAALAVVSVAVCVWLLGPAELARAIKIQSEKARQRRLARGWPWRRP